MFIVFLGPPGVGKGTQSRRLVNELGVPHISTGDMLRRAKAADSPVLAEAVRSMEAGQLVSDEVVLNLVNARLQQPDCSPGALFDGFPRTRVQAEGLDRLLAHRHTPLDLVLELYGDEQELMQRMLRRATVEQRADDQRETIQQRMRVYRQQTEPLVQYYQQRGLLERIDAMGTQDEVFQRIMGAVERHR